jgi:hypothetical protein
MFNLLDESQAGFITVARLGSALRNLGKPWTSLLNEFDPPSTQSYRLRAHSQILMPNSVCVCVRVLRVRVCMCVRV